MKTWRVFILGGICGAVITLGVVQWEGRRTYDATSVASKKQAVAEEQRKTEEVPVGDAIASVKAWAGSRSVRPNSPEFVRRLRIWAEHDPLAAREFVMSAERFPDRTQGLAVVLAVLARANAEEVASWVKANVPKTDWHDLFLPMHVLMEGDVPEQWLAFVLSFSEREMGHRPFGIGRMLGRLIEKSPAEAVRFYDRMSEGQRRDAIDNMLSAWAAKDPTAALSWARQRPDVRALNPEWGTFLQDVAAHEPKLVLDVVREAREKGDDQEHYHSSAVVRALLDASRPEGEAALALISKEAAHRAVSDWVASNLESDTVGTLVLLKRWVPVGAQGGAIREGFKNWLRSDRQSARAWADTVADPEWRAMLRAGEFLWRAEIDPADALAMLNGREEMPREMAEEARDAFSSWTLEDAPAAAEWVLKNPGLVEAGDVARLAENLVRRDEAVALGWLTKLPAGTLREAAVGEVAAVWVKRGEFSLADQIVASIADAGRREKMTFRVYRAVKSGPRGAQAEEWLDGQPVEATTKALWRREGGPE
jgi:hypothetical protein